MSRWGHKPYDPHGSEGLVLLLSVITLLAGFGMLFWLLDRTAP